MGGQSYQLAAVKSTSDPSRYTLVVHLSHRHAPLLDALASPWVLTMISPTAIAKNQVNKDHGAHWIATHTAGTGPYEITSIQPGARYVMGLNPYY